MKFLLGTKEYMTQIFREDGTVVPVTVLKTGPLTVTGKTGTNIQVGFGEKKSSRINKAQRGLSAGEGLGFAYLRSFQAGEDLEVGSKIEVSTFAPGDKVTVSAISKGKGFQGVVKRHDFKGGPRTHGQKHSEREAGSIGSTGPQRVFKGVRMAGRMGGDRITLKNLIIADVAAKEGRIYIKGAVPGRRGTLVEIRSVK